MMVIEIVVHVHNDALRTVPIDKTRHDMRAYMSVRTEGTLGLFLTKLVESMIKVSG